MTPEDIAELEQHEAQVAALIARIERERDAALAASARDLAARNRGRTERDRLRRELAAFVPPGTLAPGETPALCPTCTEVLCVPGLPGCARCTAAEVKRLRAAWDDLNALRLDEADCPGGHRATLRTAVAERDHARAEAERLGKRLTYLTDILAGAVLTGSEYATDMLHELVPALIEIGAIDTTQAERVREGLDKQQAELADAREGRAAAQMERIDDWDGDLAHVVWQRDRYRLAWESARVGRREARTWIPVADRLGAHVERLRAELTEAQRDAEQSRATAHGLGRDYRQARAELDEATGLRTYLDTHVTEVLGQLRAAEAERDEALAEVAAFRSDETDVGWLADHVRSAVAYVLGQTEPRLDDKVRTTAADRAALLIQAGSVPFIGARVVDLAIGHLKRAEARVHRAFADADIEGLDLNAMTVAELTALVMTGITRTEPTPDTEQDGGGDRG